MPLKYPQFLEYQSKLCPSVGVILMPPLTTIPYFQRWSRSARGLLASRLVICQLEDKVSQRIICGRCNRRSRPEVTRDVRIFPFPSSSPLVDTWYYVGVQPRRHVDRETFASRATRGCSETLLLVPILSPLIFLQSSANSSLRTFPCLRQLLI